MKRTRLRPDRYKMHYPLESIFIGLLLSLLLVYEFFRSGKQKSSKKRTGVNGRGHIAWLTPFMLTIFITISKLYNHKSIITILWT